MDQKTYDVIESVAGYRELEQLVKRGRQLHDQAVFDLFGRAVSKVVHLLKVNAGFRIGKQVAKDHYQGAYIKQSSRHPA